MFLAEVAEVTIFKELASPPLLYEEKRRSIF